MAKGEVVRSESDVLVIGGGITAVFAAIKAREAGAKVALVDKVFFGRGGCSALASGVLKIFFPEEDNMEAWVHGGTGGPTTRAFANEPLVRKAIGLSTEICTLMDRWGVKWIKDGGKILRVGSPGVEGPCNAMLDGGGPMMMMALRGEVLRRGIQVVNRVQLHDLLTSDGQHPTRGRVVGAIGVNTRSGAVHVFEARVTICATGPFHVPYPRLDRPYRLYGMPVDLSGDGHAMMLRAGAVMGKLEFGGMAISPWHFFAAPGMEMLFGLGGTSVLVNNKGERFLAHKNHRKEMTGRSSISLAVARELKEGRGPVCVDITFFTPEQRRLLKQVIPIVMGNWEAAGFDPAKDAVPYTSIFMATHSVSGGGVQVNEQMETTLPGLLAGGNCSDGAYMSMAQALPQCAAMGYIAGENAGVTYAGTAKPALVEEQVKSLQEEILRPLKREGKVTYEAVHGHIDDLYSNFIGLTLREEMGQKAVALIQGPLRDSLGKIRARDPRELGKVLGLKNFVQALEAILQVLLHRKESRGNVLRPDYPRIDNVEWLKYTRARLEHGGQLTIWDEPLPQERIDSLPRTKELHPFFRDVVIS